MNPDPSKTPAAEEPGKDRLLDHVYDGIQEYDNPLPGWWVWIFWATIAFSVLYVLNLPGIGVGQGRVADYEREVRLAAERQARLEAERPKVELTDASLAAMASDPAALSAGRTVFTTYCVPCHGADGGGTIGPNLTDDYWIHGGRPFELHRTVETGVLDKGMPAWGQVLKPEQVTAVTAYVISLHGTSPANPKPPQGVLVQADSAGAPATGAPGRP